MSDKNVGGYQGTASGNQENNKKPGTQTNVGSTQTGAQKGDNLKDPSDRSTDLNRKGAENTEMNRGAGQNSGSTAGSTSSQPKAGNRAGEDDDSMDSDQSTKPDTTRTKA